MMNRDEVFEVVRLCILEVLPDVEHDAVTLGGTLSDLGANSIDRADIVTMSMEKLGITVPVTEFQRVHDIPSLVTLLQEYA
jgi:polyketide biosynthesis acyl carrier protein